MSNRTPMEKVVAMLKVNQKPSYSDLEAALGQCVEERELYRISTNELSSFMAKVAFARIKRDEAALNQTVDAFIAKVVVPHLPADVAINTPNGMVH